MGYGRVAAWVWEESALDAWGGGGGVGVVGHRASLAWLRPSVMCNNHLVTGLVFLVECVTVL